MTLQKVLTSYHYDKRCIKNTLDKRCIKNSLKIHTGPIYNYTCVLKCFKFIVTDYLHRYQSPCPRVVPGTSPRITATDNNRRRSDRGACQPQCSWTHRAVRLRRALWGELIITYMVQKLTRHEVEKLVDDEPCVCLIPKGSTQKMYKYSLYNSTRLIKPNP